MVHADQAKPFLDKVNDGIEDAAGPAHGAVADEHRAPANAVPYLMVIADELQRVRPRLTVQLHTDHQARGFDAIGCEMSARGSSFARAHGLRFVRAKAPGLPFDDGTFDLVTSAHVIEHVGDPQAPTVSRHELVVGHCLPQESAPRWCTLDGRW